MMDTHFTETMRLLRNESHLVAMVLVLAAGLLLPQWIVMATLDAGGGSYWIFVQLLCIPVVMGLYLFAPAVLFHAVGRKATGRPVSFFDSCKAVLVRMPALALFFSGLLLVYLGLIPAIESTVPAEYLSITRILTLEFGVGVDGALNWVDRVILDYVVFYFIVAPYVLLIPACMVLSGQGILTAYRRNAEVRDSITSHHAASVTPFAIAALILAHAGFGGMFAWLTGMQADALLRFALQSLSIQFGAAFVLLATIPIWRRIEKPAIDTSTSPDSPGVDSSPA